MAIFKCKMCGGSLEINSETVATCEYCGMQQTLPKLNDDRRANLYDRANHFRRNNEFDKAMGIYEQILNDDTTDAEAYWSLVLCRYGIEYVEDPASHKRVPTVNRAQFTSIFDDDNYKSALQYADADQRAVYEAEAKTINEIQKGILAISQKEEPFDVFICYKETDRNGRRTPDSVLANDLYHQLTQEGFKVFFSRITLEDKLGVAYEPYIFAALNSSRVMVVLGTKPEYFNAVWVKNEWSRYLALIKNGAKKILVPAYKDMDPYDLPEEFSHLQAQDMSKLGFMQDLIRGIKKITQTDMPKTAVVRETVISGSNGNVAALLERVFMFLEDGDWNSANEYCEKVLDFDPKNAQAYLGKLMVELQVRKTESLKDQAVPFAENSNYQKALRFADAALNKELVGYIEHIQNRNEHARLEKIYNDAAKKKIQARTEEEYKAVAASFKTIAEYRDAEKLRQQCLEMAEYARKDAIYANGAMLLSRRVISDIEQAIGVFESVSGWKDADAKVDECRQKIERIKRENEERRIQEAKEKKIRTKKTIIGCASGAAIVAMLVLLFTVILPTINYNQADKLLAAGEYEAAMEGFRELNFEDSYEKYCEAFNGVKDGYKKIADDYYAEGNYIQAAINYTKAGRPIYAEEVFDFGSIIKAGIYTTAGISADGHVYYQTNEKYNDTQESDVQNMTSFYLIEDHLVGLSNTGNIKFPSGTIEGVTSRSADLYTEMEQTTGVVDLVEYSGNYYALLSDGTVKYFEHSPSTSNNTYVGTTTWENIVSIQQEGSMLIGIDDTGYVLIAYEKGTGNNQKFPVESWSDVAKVYYYNNDGILIGITNAKTIVVACKANYDEIIDPELLSYTDVVDIAFGFGGMMVLHEDGTVSLEFVDKESESYKVKMHELSAWNGIVSLIDTGISVVGIRYDGTIKVTGNLASEIETWTDVIWVESARDSLVNASASAWYYSVGVKSDGTVVSTGNGEYYWYTWYNNGDGGYHKKHTDGTYNDVSHWKLW